LGDLAAKVRSRINKIKNAAPITLELAISKLHNSM
jgi:hypothetical protein